MIAGTTCPGEGVTDHEMGDGTLLRLCLSMPGDPVFLRDCAGLIVQERAGCGSFTFVNDNGAHPVAAAALIQGF